MKNRPIYGILLVFAMCTLSYAQDSDKQGDGDDHPAVPSLGRGEVRPHVWIHKFIGPNAIQAATTYMTPAMMTAAYGVNAVPGLGQGATVAIVDAYDSPNVASDLAGFMSQWGISCTTGGGKFTKVNQNGNASPLPGYDSGWEVETSMDTQWVRAMAPCANIVLVEANSNNDSDLMTAVATAGTMGSVVSMSWGGGEFSSQTSYDSFFVKNSVTFLASSGDTGGVVEWPSSSPNVIGVGGTNLTFNSNGSVASETAWNGSGGGCSVVESKISAQAGFVPSSCQNRATPDVSMDGGNSSPAYVLISGQGGWYVVYGTSLSVQLWAGVIALANGLRSAPLNGTLGDLYADAAGIPSSAPYTNNYRDITSGQAGSFSAGPGWDFVTGLGSPLANSLVPSYLATQGSGAPVLTKITVSPASASVQTGGTQQFTATGYDQFGNPMSPQPAFAWSVSGGGSISASGLFTAGSTAGGPFTVTASRPNVSGTASVTVTNPQATFTIGISPSSRTVTHPASGGIVSTTYTVTITPSGGFNSNVSLTASGARTGISLSLSQTTVTGPNWTSMLTATVSSSATHPRTRTLTVTGTGGGITKSASATLVIQ